MSEPNFTPGPWIAKTLRHESACGSSVEYTVYGPSGEFIATIWGSPENQKLIAAAPEMLNELEVVQKAMLAIAEYSADEEIKESAHQHAAHINIIAKKARGEK